MEPGTVLGQIGQKIQARGGCEGQDRCLILRQELGVEEVEGGPLGLDDAHIVVADDVQEDEELAVQAHRLGHGGFIFVPGRVIRLFRRKQEVFFKIGDLLPLTIVEEDKVLPAQIGHGPALCIGDIDLDQLERDRHVVLEPLLRRGLGAP